jgi:hypothetical protein
MFSDVVQLKLQKPVIEPDEGVPLTTLGKNKIFFTVFCFLSFELFKDVEHVSILINNKIIYFLLVLKKEKFINVQNHIIINFWIHSMLIIWQFILYVGIHFIQKFLSVVPLIGQ